MATNPIVTPNVLGNTQPRVAETSKRNLESVLERCEEVLRKAFGDDEETIANSLRGL